LSLCFRLTSYLRAAALSTAYAPQGKKVFYRFALAFVRHWYVSAPPQLLQEGMAKMRQEGHADGVLPPHRHATPADEAGAWSAASVLDSFGFAPARSSSVQAMLGRRTTAIVRGRRRGSLSQAAAAASGDAGASYTVRNSLLALWDTTVLTEDAFGYQ